MRPIHFLFPVLLALSGAALADPCAQLATRFAQDPKGMKIGELDELKTCVSDIQRELISLLGDASRPTGQGVVARPRPLPVLQDAD
ncbi:MAG: hypothetical protein ACK4UT_01570 [Moraxellaceae bacterium]